QRSTTLITSDPGMRARCPSGSGRRTSPRRGRKRSRTRKRRRKRRRRSPSARRRARPRNPRQRKRKRRNRRRKRLRVRRSRVKSRPDRKSTRLNSSHLVISYAVFCLKKKKKTKKSTNI